MNDLPYAGGELDLFAGAHNWKSYWSQQVKPFLRGDILEVGAGIGANLPFLDEGHPGRWVCLEPDARLAERLHENTKSAAGRTYETICGTLQSVADQRFDTILYIDVIEHINNDAAELRAAASCLRRAGHLIVLVPAHQRLFSEFDRAIGHFRRYDRRALRRAVPRSLQLRRLRYLDSAGVLASAANAFLRQSTPTHGQISFWDRCVVPVSRAIDPLLAYRLGKSLVGVWQKAP